MSKVRTGLCSLVVMLAGSVLQAPAQKPQTTTPFVLDADRPYVYLKFDHLGPGVPRDEDEPSLRLWFKFVNNSHVPIEVDTFGVPEGSLKNEAGVMDMVVANEVGGDGAVTILPPMSSPLPFGSAVAQRAPEKMPHGYWFHVGSTMSIPPGSAVFFSLPISHLSTQWHVQIPFRFEAPRGRAPRDPDIGGEPEMFLAYFLADLPDHVREALKR
jgi:hypothetical protein